jgi:hypothetical protein
VAAANPTGTATGGNVRMNTNTRPPVPQNETSVAASLVDPMVAVAGANDYVNGGLTLMRTLDGGRTWSTVRATPEFGFSHDICTGGDPSVAYSLRDRAFYAAQLCFFRTNAVSEIYVFKSVDNGRTWTPGRHAARAATNVDYTTGTVDESVFNDRETITVDNAPGSPFFGRLYVAYTKFNLLPDGFGDYCPIQLAATDAVPTDAPFTALFRRTSVVPDAPGADGTGPTANQVGYPQVEADGTVDVLYAEENCNNGLDQAIHLQKSADGGVSWLPSPLPVTKPGQFHDNPDRADLLPPGMFRAPLSPSLAYNAATGTLAVVYPNLSHPSSGSDLSLQLSSDGGRHWTDARTLSVEGSGQPARNDQFFGAVTASPDGLFTAIWYDRRRDPANHLIDTWQAWSADNGDTWTQRRVGTRSWNPDNAFFLSGAFIGDYLGVAASTGAYYPVWADGRLSPRNTHPNAPGSSDIFTNVESRSSR